MVAKNGDDGKHERDRYRDEPVMEDGEKGKRDIDDRCDRSGPGELEDDRVFMNETFRGESKRNGSESSAIAG